MQDRRGEDRKEDNRFNRSQTASLYQSFPNRSNQKVGFLWQLGRHSYLSNWKTSKILRLSASDVEKSTRAFTSFKFTQKNICIQSILIYIQSISIIIILYYILLFLHLNICKTVSFLELGLHSKHGQYLCVLANHIDAVAAYSVMCILFSHWFVALGARLCLRQNAVGAWQIENAGRNTTPYDTDWTTHNHILTPLYLHLGRFPFFPHHGDCMP